MLCHERPALSQRGSLWTAAALVGSLLVATGCKGAAGSSGVGGSFPVDAGSCATDPLHTGLPPLFNGNSVDSDDCPILEFTAKYGEPDAMIFKAIIYVESRFQYDAVGCTSNSGCCPQWGWAGAECGCLGAMQTGPWCDPSNLPPGCSASNLGLLATDHVDLETSPSAGDWQTRSSIPRSTSISASRASPATGRRQRHSSPGAPRTSTP